jgi:hypothetical protein
VRVVAVAGVALAAQLPLDTANLGPTGVLMWMFVALASREECSFCEYSSSLDGGLVAPPPVSTGPAIAGILGPGRETFGARLPR